MPALPPSTYLRIARASALYDIVQALPFATPWTFALVYDALSRLNIWLGAPALPPCAPPHLLLGTLLGTLVLLWSVSRLGAPSLRLGRYDGAGRLLFACWIAWAMTRADMPVLWLFLLPEIAWGVAQWWPVARTTPAGVMLLTPAAAAPRARP